MGSEALYGIQSYTVNSESMLVIRTGASAEGCRACGSDVSRLKMCTVLAGGWGEARVGT